MKKIALALAAAATAAVLLVPAAFAKEIGSGGAPAPAPAPAPSTAPCAAVDSIALTGKKSGADAFRFEITGGYQVSSCSSQSETVTIHVTWREYFSGVVAYEYDDQTVTLLPGKNVRGALALYGLPGRATYGATITVTDAATGAVLVSRTGVAGTPAPKV